MGQVIKVPTIERHIVTQQGEVQVTINLNLTIKIDQDGSISVQSSPTIEKTVEKSPEKPRYEIPEFNPVDLINFGDS